jgi:uncharacterized membrane protein YozB (DUF420 family)
MARAISELGPSTVRAALARRPRTRFFVAMSAAILAIVLVGFAPTLYLRELLDVPPIPVYLYVHGALLTAWFVLVVAQTALIRRGAVATHRLLGAAAFFVGVAVVVVSAIVTFRLVGRILHTPAEPDVHLSVMMGLGADRPLIGLAAIALWGNLTSLLTFTVLLGCAVVMRNRGDVHKRLMMLASLSLLPPAIARISRWPGLGGDLGPCVPIVLLVLLSAMVCFDLYTRRNVHRATLVGGGLVVLGIVASTVVARSDFGLSVLRRLG